MAHPQVDVLVFHHAGRYQELLSSSSNRLGAPFAEGAGDRQAKPTQGASWGELAASLLRDLG